METERISEKAIGGCVSGQCCASGGAMETSACDGLYSQPPAQYSDPSTIVPPQSLQELIERLHDIFAHEYISVEYVQKLMALYPSNPREWKKFAKWDKHRYTRNLVDDGNGKFNLMILCWNEGQGSSIHSHANSHCFLKVLDGTAKEEMFYWPEKSQHEETMDDDGGENNVEKGSTGEENSGMQKWADNELMKDECGYINDEIGLHRVENPSHSNKTVTLHLYSPPFDECACFDQRTGKQTTAKVTFWSKFGKRTPFGRHPNRPTPETAENN